MHWHDDYLRKCLSAQEAVRLINSGDRLFTSGNVATHECFSVPLSNGDMN